MRIEQNITLFRFVYGTLTNFNDYLNLYNLMYNL